MDSEFLTFVGLNITPKPGFSDEQISTALKRLVLALDKKMFDFKFEFTPEGRDQ